MADDLGERAGSMRVPEAWEQAFDSISDMIAILDDRQRIVHLNRAMARNLGRPPQECMGKPCYTLMHACGAPPEGCPHALTMRDGMEHTFEMHEDRLGGDFLFTTSPLRDPDGCLVGTVHVARDITAGKRAERENAASAVLLAWGQSAVDMINAMREGVILLETDGTIVSVNPAVERLTGLAGGAIAGRKMGWLLPLLLDEPDLAKALDGLRILRGGALPELSPLRLRRADGTSCYVLPSLSRMGSPGGVKGLVVMTLVDMTDLHSAAHRLRALAERLATSEEQNRWQIARYIHDAIVQNLSLACIRLGSMAKLPAGPGTDEMATNLRQVRALLDDAIAECRLVMSDLTPALLYELGLVPALNDLVHELDVKHGARITVEDDGQDLSVMVHPLRGLLFQTTRELIMNALKHAGPCRIRVTVNCRGGLLVIRVNDDGRGFDVASADTHREHHGGFGLFSIRQRLEGLGGRLDLVSAPGRGTTATIGVPIQAATA